MDQLSKHFTFDEMTDSGLFPALVKKNREEAQFFAEPLKKLATTLLEPLREKFGKPVVVSSGFCGPELNAALGRKRTSQHMLGEAADVQIDGILPQQIFDFYRYSALPVGQCIWEPHCVHISLGYPYRPAYKCGEYLRQIGKEYVRV